MKYLDKIAEFIATACYVGKIKIAPGTFGSLVAFPICYIIMDFSLKNQVVFHISGYNLHEQQFLSVFFIEMFIAIILFIVIYSITAVTGIDPHTTFWSKATRYTGLFFFLHVTLFSWVISLLAESKEWFSKIITAIFFSGLVFSILSNLGTDGLDILWFNKTNQADGFMIGNSTFAGTFLLMSFFIGLWWAWGIDGVKRTWWQKVLPFIVLLNPMFLNIHSGIGEARAASVSVFLGALIWIGYLFYDRIKNGQVRRYIKWGSFALAGLILVGATISFIQPQGFVRQKYESLSGAARPLVWEIAGNAIAERPWLGWGADNFDTAFIKHFDTRLFHPEFGGEVWFDRAHNIFIDTLVDMGIIGLVAYLAVYGAAFFMLWKLAHVDDRQKQHFAVAGFLLLGLHLLEIQTAFDTVTSYIILGIIFTLIHAYYVQAGFKKSIHIHNYVIIGFGIILVGFAGFGFIKNIQIMRANYFNGIIREQGSSQKRMVIYPNLLGSSTDKSSFIWRTVTDLERGILSTPSVLEKSNQVAGFVTEFDYFGNEYKKYLDTHPNDFRALLNTADTYLFMRLFQEDRLSDALIYIERAEQVVPQHPMPEIMKTVIAVYQNKFKEAYQHIEKAKSLDPTNPYTLQTEEWLKKQEKTFPEIDFRFMQYL